MDGNDEMDEFKTGTTTLGLTTDEGVVLAADKRASIGRLASSKNATKIYELDDSIGMTIAGSVGDAQKIVRMMRSQLRLHKLETKELSVRGAGTLLSNILHESKMLPYMNQFIMGGLEDEGVLFTLGPGGSLMEHRDYTATGSGTKLALGVLEDSYEEEMNHEEGIELAKKAVEASMERDTGSGNGVMVAEITENGFEVVEDVQREKQLAES